MALPEHISGRLLCRAQARLRRGKLFHAVGAVRAVFELVGLFGDDLGRLAAPVKGVVAAFWNCRSWPVDCLCSHVVAQFSPSCRPSNPRATRRCLFPQSMQRPLIWSGMLLDIQATCGMLRTAPQFTEGFSKSTGTPVARATSGALAAGTTPLFSQCSTC